MNAQKLGLLVCGLFMINQGLAKKVPESRAKIQETIATSAADILKKTQEQVRVCACHLRDKKSNKKNVASVLESLADTQMLMFDILQELVEGGSDDRWALARREQLLQIRTVLQDVAQQCADKKNDVLWWHEVCVRINRVLPATSKQDRE